MGEPVLVQLEIAVLGLQKPDGGLVNDMTDNEYNCSCPLKEKMNRRRRMLPDLKLKQCGSSLLLRLHGYLH